MIYFALLLPPCGILSVVLRELVVYLISVLATIDAPQGAAPPPIVPEVIEVILVHAPRHMGEEARRSNQLTKPGPGRRMKLVQRVHYPGGDDEVDSTSSTQEEPLIY